MAGAAPTENLEYTADRDIKLHKEVADNSTKAGYPVTEADVNPENDSPIKNIADILRKTAGHTIQSISGEEGPSTHMETVSGSRAVHFIKEKMRRLGGLKKAA